MGKQTDGKTREVKMKIPQTTMEGYCLGPMDSYKSGEFIIVPHQGRGARAEPKVCPECGKTVGLRVTGCGWDAHMVAHKPPKGGK